MTISRKLFSYGIPPDINPRQSELIIAATRFCLEHNYFKSENEYYLHKLLFGTAMGANFAFSYANLTMGLWETSCVRDHNFFAEHLVFYGRSIDDIIVIWDGPNHTIQDFVTHCNSNNFGLSFTSGTNTTSLCFLGLELSHLESTMIAKNYTKPTDGNSFLLFSSCHSPRWLKNVQKSQFCCLRYNCSRLEDYTTQSISLKICRQRLPSRPY